ncbi:MAG TPA: hypothetical protein VGE07_11120 [Herpetosiphonaceae bacterium]
MSPPPKRPPTARPRSAYAVPPPPDPWLADKEALIRSAFQTCNQLIAALAAEQVAIRQQITLQGDTGSMGARYRALEDRRRHALRQRHQIQVASFTLDQQSVDHLTHALAILLQSLTSTAPEPDPASRLDPRNQRKGRA